jgi:outer membrane protein OmpA-like peptidoglycan-associated protein
MSPYMVQFAGYKVEKGKLTLRLQYNVVNKKLTASNNIFIDQFELGEKVENPNAVSLPLELAVALLKDSSGNIKLDVPITGSLDDPKFSVVAVVVDALTNVLSKVVASPFRTLGLLIGDEKNMSTISFAAGNSSLNKQQQAKLDSLAKALKERPDLNLDIKGAAFEDQDWPVIREDALYEQLKKRRATEINKSAEKKIRDEYVELSDDDYKRLLADMFIEKFPLLAEKSFLGTPQLMDPKAGDFYEIAKQKLFTIIKAEQWRLKRLASARAQAIANYVIKKGGVPRERVFILDTVIDPQRDNKEIVSKLSLKAN